MTPTLPLAALALFLPLAAAAQTPVAGGQEAQAKVLTPAPAQTPAQKEQKPEAKRPVRAEDYGRWESLGFRSALAPDGRWLAYGVGRVDGEDELRLRMLATEAVETFEYGQRPSFSADSRWLAYSIGVSEKEQEKIEKAKKKLHLKLGLRDLVKGDTAEIEKVASFAFSDDGRFLAMRRYPSEDGASGGANLVVRELASGTDTSFGNVGAYAWSEEGALLALAIEAQDRAGNGLQLYDPGRGTLRTLDSADADYGPPVWREEGYDLALMRTMEHDEEDEEEGEDVPQVVLTWRGLDTQTPRRRELDPRKRDSFSKDMRVVEFAGLRWSDDGGAVFFGIKEWERKPEWLDEKKEKEKEAEKGKEKAAPAAPGAEEKPEQKPEQGAEKKPAEEERGKSLRESLDDPAGVEVWHARDIDVVPRQKRTLRQDERESWLVAWWLDEDRMVRLGTELTEDVLLQEGQRHAIGLDNTPYETEKRFGPTLFDVYAIDVATGARQKLAARVKYPLGSSPDGRWFAYVLADHVWAANATTGEVRNLTAGVEARFIDQENSSLTDQKPPYGVAGWCVRSDELFLYDRYDLWMLRLDGSGAVRLTRGAEERNRYRRVVLDEEQDEFVDLTRTVYLSVYGDRTKKSGYARIAAGQLPETLVWKDAAVGRLSKAEEAEVYTFVEQRFDDSPDLFVAGPALADARPVSRTNPFQDEYLWGRSELVEYTNAYGEELQGALFYPAGYEPGKKYPMIVYIYELRSQVVHRYEGPSERSAYNTAVFTAEGYFVFQPDIVYRPQNPGLSAVECVVPAVKKVLETGMIDPAGVGLVGHSWGAYQTAFLVTQTDVFAAGVAGAPLTNMMSMAGSVYWNSGQTDAWIFHESQGRMDRPFWRDVDTYIRNSPIFQLDRLTTPLMIAFGDEDGAVDWNQGVELYNAARLAGKQFVMLVYPGENHGLRKKPNQVDYHYRILEWFGHYLKGDPAPGWITEGQTWIDRKKELEELERKKKDKKKPKKGPTPER